MIMVRPAAARPGGRRLTYAGFQLSTKWAGELVLDDAPAPLKRKSGSGKVDVQTTETLETRQDAISPRQRVREKDGTSRL